MLVRSLAVSSLLAALLAPVPSAAPAPAKPIGEAPICVVPDSFATFRQGALTVFQLDGSNSFDPEGDPFTVLWTAPPWATFDDPNSLTPNLSVLTPPSGSTLIVPIRMIAFNDDGISFCRLYVSIMPEIEASLDIKPTSCPNPQQVNRKGWLPVALVGSAGFDVSLVDVSTVVLKRSDGVGGSVSPSNHSYEDVATPFEGELCDCHELGADGTLDLSLKFDNTLVRSALLLDAVANGTALRLRVEGLLLDESPFFAEDCVRIQQ